MGLGRCRVPDLARRFRRSPTPDVDGPFLASAHHSIGVAIRLSRLSVVAAGVSVPNAERQARQRIRYGFLVRSSSVVVLRGAIFAKTRNRGVAPGLDRVWNAFADAAIGRVARLSVTANLCGCYGRISKAIDSLGFGWQRGGQAGLGRRPISSAFGRRRTLGVVARQPIFSAATFGARFEVAFSGSLVGGPRAGPLRCG